MRTKKETYSSQTRRESFSISKNTTACNPPMAKNVGINLEQLILASPWKTRKTMAQFQAKTANLSKTNVIKRTFGFDDISDLGLSKNDDEATVLPGGEIELKERKMKDVLGNISKYAIIAIATLSMVMGQGAPMLHIQIEDQKVNLTEDELRDASQINYLPGDTLRYVITASNIGDGLMKNPEIIDPVPGGVTYVAGSARGADSEINFSMNQGSAYMPWPPYYTVRNSKGILVKREATPEMISHIKWNINRSFNPGEATTVEFIVVVNK